MYNKSRDHYNSIKNELKRYENAGIKLSIDGHISNAEEVAWKCTLREDSSYMRDYIMDDDGNISEIGFNEVKI